MALAGMSFSKKPIAEREVTITRVFAAPRPLVFSMFTEAKHMAAWWGPHQWDTARCEADARPGGKMLVHMRGPDGHIQVVTGVYHEIVPHERIAFANVVEAPDGTTFAESLNTVRFETAGRNTRVILRAHAGVFDDKASFALFGMEAGWAQTLDKLAGHAMRENRNPDAGDQAAIRAMFADRTNGLFCKGADLALRHLAADAVSYALPPPLQRIGTDRAETEAWFATWDGPIGWAMGELAVEIGGDIAFAYGLGHMTGTKTDGDKVDLWTRVTVGLARRDGAWTVVHQHTSVPFLMDGSDKAAVDLKP